MDLSKILQQTLQTNLQVSLDAAVQAGDTAAAREVAKQIGEFAAATTTPAATGPKYTQKDISTALKAKAPWFGTDPRKSAKAIEFGKNMDVENFGSADLFADALLKAVDEEFKPAGDKDVEGDDDKDVGGDDDKDVEGDEPPPRRKKTDSPSGADGGRGAPPRGKSSGPWTKLADAPPAIAEAIRAQAVKFTSRATKEQKEKFMSEALGAAYRAHTAKPKGK